MFLISSTIIVILSLCFYLSRRWKLSYWWRRGLETYEPKFMDQGQQYFDSYFHFKGKGLKHGGTYLFSQPHYVPVDLDLIKMILISNFDHFANRGFVEYKDDANFLNRHLLYLEDNFWKDLRNKLTPSLSSGKMKTIFEITANTGKELEKVLGNHADSNTPFETKDMTSRFSMDVIGSVAFGIDSNCLSNEKSEFVKFSRTLNENLNSNLIVFLLFANLPKQFKSVFDYFLKKRLRKTANNRFTIKNFFQRFVTELVEYREKNNISRNDFFHLLLQLKNKDNNNKLNKESENEHTISLSMNEIIAESFLYYVGGFDTSSTSMAFGLYELAKNQEIQDKLREEIQQALIDNDGMMSYDVIMNLPYLDKVMSEILRMYPPGTTLFRTCKKDFPVPNTNYVIKRNDFIQIPLTAIHRDPEYYPDPNRFDPERFTPANRAEWHPFQYIPFGEGPRKCLGTRFGQVQVKVALCYVVHKFRVTPNSKTNPKARLAESFLSSGIEGEIWLNIEKI